MKRNYKIKTIAAMLAAATVFTQSYNITFSNQGIDNDSAYQYKIDAKLLTKIKLSDDDEKIPVWIWFNDVDKETISDKIEEKGYDSEIFEDEKAFEEVVVSQAEKEVVEEFGEEIAHATGEAIKEYTDVENIEEENLSLVDLAVNEEVDEYNECKREAVKEVCAEETEEFIDTLVEEDDIMYNNDYSKTLIVEATKEEIFNYAKQDDVEEISLYEETTVEPCGELAFEQIGLSGTGGTKTSAYNDGKGYSGVGIKIGVLEYKGRYNSDDYMLKSINNKRLFFVENIRSNKTKVPYSNDKGDDNNKHATFVVKLLAGQDSPYKGNNYTGNFEGVVPNATVYQMTIETLNDVLLGFQQLADKGVSIINMSFGFLGKNLYYDYYERELDKLISNTGITTVISAGNEESGKITSPGRCINAVSVGNANTKASTFQKVSGTVYKMASDSSYISGTNLPNKPDIAAPGTNIVVPTSLTGYTCGEGTSYSAPITAGVIAQMMEARSFLKFNFNTVKSTLFAAADPDKIYTNNQEIVGNMFIHEKSGVGLVDAKKAIDVAESSNRWGFLCPNALDTVNDTGDDIYLKKGQKIRAVMVFNNADNSISSLTDMDIYLCNLGGTTVARSNSSYNNVEVIEYTVPSTGNYYFKVSGWRVKAGTYCSYTWLIK